MKTEEQNNAGMNESGNGYLMSERRRRTKRERRKKGRKEGRKEGRKKETKNLTKIWIE